MSKDDDVNPGPDAEDAVRRVLDRLDRLEREAPIGDGERSGPLPGALEGKLGRRLLDDLGQDAEVSLEGQSFGHLRMGSRLGSGGMGEVYEARDDRLQRTVAVKVIGSGQRLSSQARRRFLDEARLLSRVDHPGICRLFEFVQSYEADLLVLERIDGKTLRELGELEWTEAIDLARQMASAVAAAHAAGVIHRDLKPANVMRTTDGQIKVLDFGIARDHAADEDPSEGSPVGTGDATETRTIRFGVSPEPRHSKGSVAGTLRYMSPEQARGEIVTAATDVFSMGVLLQELFSGEHPYPGLSETALWKAVAAGSTRPASTRSQVLNRLLERMKDPTPTRRPSMTEVEASLQFIADSPVRRRRKALAWGVVSVLIALIALASWISWQARNTGARRARVAGTLGRQVQEAEDILRKAHLSPQHDTSPLRSRIRSSLPTLVDPVDQTDDFEIASRQLAAGQILLALGDFDAALVHFENSWSRGLRTPEVARGRGRVLARLYDRALRRAAHQSEVEARERERQLAEARYGRPAVEWLRRAESSGSGVGQLAAAELALLDGRAEDALAAAQELLTEHPWLYEAHLLSARAAVLETDQLSAEGKNREEIEAIDAAIEAANRAVEVGRSDPSAWGELCYFWDRRLALEVVSEVDLVGGFQMAEASCRAAAESATGDSEGWEHLVRLYRTRVWAASEENRHYEEVLVDLERQADEGLRRFPDSPVLVQLRGDAARHRATLEAQEGRDPTASLRQAIDWIERSTRLDPADGGGLYLLGLSWFDLAYHQLEVGGDVGSPMRRAIDALEAALAAGTADYGPWTMLGAANGILGLDRLQKGVEPQPYLEDSVLAFEEATELRPGSPWAWANLAMAHRDLARWQTAIGTDPSFDIQRGLAVARRAVEVKTDLHSVHLTRAELLLEGARWEHREGRDPRESLLGVHQALSRADEAEVEVSAVTLCRASAHLLEARWAQRQKESPSAALQRAQQALRQAEALGVWDYEIAPVRAEVAFLGESSSRGPEGQCGPRSIEALRTIVDLGLAGNSESLHLRVLDHLVDRMPESCLAPQPFRPESKAVDAGSSHSEVLAGLVANWERDLWGQ